MDSDVKEYKLFDAESVVVDWIHHEQNENMHHIGIFYIVTLEDNSLKSDADGQDSLGAKWYEISDLTENDVSPLVWIELEKLRNSKIT